jgi:hypothetical protein
VGRPRHARRYGVSLAKEVLSVGCWAEPSLSTQHSTLNTRLYFNYQVKLTGD